MVRAAPGANALEAVRRELSTLDAKIIPFNARSMNQQIRGIHVSSKVRCRWT